MKSPIDKKIAVAKKDRYAYWSFIYLMVMLLFSGYVEFRIIWHIVILLIGTFLLMVYPEERKKIFGNVGMILIVGGCLLITIISTWLYGGSWSIILSNLRSMGYSLFALIIITIAVLRNDTLILQVLKRRIVLLNVVLIINIFVTAIQARGTGFLIKDSWLVQNPYYDDQVAGLFGFNATNHLGMYSVFIMLLNFAYARNDVQNKLKKREIYIYTITMEALMAIISKYNDNAGFYIVAALFAGLYMLYDFAIIEKNFLRKTKSFAKYSFIIFIAVILFFNVPATKDVLDKYLRNRVEVMLHFNAAGMTGSNERLYQVQYGLSNSFGWLIGKGFGTAKFVQADAHGFFHFGICSAGSYIILLGVWFYLLYILMYSKMLYSIIHVGRKKDGWVFLAILAVMVIFSLYLPVFNDARSVILIAFYAIAFRYMNVSNKKVIKKRYIQMT